MRTKRKNCQDFGYNLDMDPKFGGVIWTNHAIQRMEERGISQGDAWATWRRPDQSRYASAKGAWVYYKTYPNNKIEVVAKKNERGEWIILSVWSKQAYGQETKPEPFMRFLFKKIFRK